MTQSNTEVDPADAAAITAYEEALRDFTTELNRLHISFGAPSYATLAGASVRPKLTKAGLNEALSGKRLPSLETLLEFVRVVSNPLPPPPGAPATRAHPDLLAAWRTRWQHVKFLQRQAQNPWKNVRATAQQTLDQALRDAETIRATAHEEAARIRTDAEHQAETLRTETASDASAAKEAAETLAAAQEEAARRRREAEELLGAARQEAEQERERAREQSEELLAAARSRVKDAQTEAVRLVKEAQDTAERVRAEAQASAERVAKEAAETLAAAQEEAARRRREAEELAQLRAEMRLAPAPPDLSEQQGIRIVPGVVDNADTLAGDAGEAAPATPEPVRAASAYSADNLPTSDDSPLDAPTAVAVSVTLPELGERVTEATVTRWYKAVGDRVEHDELLVEVATDKADTGLPCPVAGVLVEILVGEDETVPIGVTLAVIRPAPQEAPSVAAPEPPAELATRLRLMRADRQHTAANRLLDTICAQWSPYQLDALTTLLRSAGQTIDADRIHQNRTISRPAQEDKPLTTGPAARRLLPPQFRSTATPERDRAQLMAEAMQRSPAELADLYQRQPPPQRAILRAAISQRSPAEQHEFRDLLQRIDRQQN